MSKNKQKNRKKSKQRPGSVSGKAPERRVINLDKLLSKWQDLPDPGPGFLVVPLTTTTYKCCTEEDGTPSVGCGFEFMEPEPTSHVFCPKCGNFWVKWVHFDHNEDEDKL